MRSKFVRFQLMLPFVYLFFCLFSVIGILMGRGYLPVLILLATVVAWAVSTIVKECFVAYILLKQDSNDENNT